MLSSDNIIILFITTIISFFTCAIIIYNKPINIFLTKLNKTKSHHLIQKKIPRFGSMAIFLTLLIHITFIEKNFSNNYFFIIIAVVTPFFIIGLIEDLTNNVPPYLRLIFSFIPGMGLYYFGYSLNSSGIFIIDIFIQNKILILFLTIFFIATYCHAFNMIDGLNGLASGISMIIFVAISYLSYQTNNLEIFDISILMLCSVFGFFVFNWPKGKIFLGDAGSYLLGSIISIILIMYININNKISMILLLPIISYPLIEIIFITLKRLINKKHLFTADQNHIHHMVFFYLTKKKILNGKSVSKNSFASFLILLIYGVFIFIYLTLLTLFIL